MTVRGTGAADPHLASANSDDGERKNRRFGSSRRAAHIAAIQTCDTHADVPPGRRRSWSIRRSHMGHLKGCLIEFCRAYLRHSTDVPVRFRPSYFPFTEPSAEVDIGCSREGRELADQAISAKVRTIGSKFIGCGMVHPKCAPNMVASDPDEIPRLRLWHGAGTHRDAEIRHPRSAHFFDADIRWLKHYGFVPLAVPSMVRGL